MFWRAFVQADDKSEVDILPAWFVSFDGEQFVEVNKKPTLDNEAMLRACWGVAVNGPDRRGRAQRRQLIASMVIRRRELGRVAEFEEVSEKMEDVTLERDGGVDVY